MSRALRKIITIDREKCNGCGQCVHACHEGAIEMVDGKAKLVSDVYCDGLGACIGDCPVGAITIVEREAEAFSEAAVKQKKTKLPCGCPGTAVKTMEKKTDSCFSGLSSQLTNWPVQLMLVPVSAPYLNQADLLIAADCVPFAFAGFHGLLKDKVLLVGCPKLDDASVYVEKLTQIFASQIRSVSVTFTEVPCCNGLVQIVKKAMEKSGKKIPLKLIRISISGEIISQVEE